MVAVTESVVSRESKEFNIPVLSLIKAAQTQHGLRHGDYQRYQQYVTRKLRRMRKSLRFQQGTRSKVVPKKMAAEIITDVRYLVLAVFEIERSWAYAMQLKAEANSEPRKRFHMISRLRKAKKRAQLLYDLTVDSHFCDAQTKLELTAYIQWICGILHFEQQDWIKAKELLETSQSIYSGLATSVDEDLNAVYTGRINELLPQIRYCAYSIGDESAASELRELRNLVATEGSNALAEYQLDELLKQVQAMQAVSVTEIEWLGITIPVKIEKARLAVLSVQEADTELRKVASSQKKATICESTLKLLVDAIFTLREEITSLSSSDTSTSKKFQNSVNIGFDKLSRLQRLYTYLQYLKLNKTIWRTLYQLEALMSTISPEHRHLSLNLITSGYHKSQELARLYDIIVQNLQEVFQLPGEIAENSELKGLIKAKTLAYKSLKCYYLALAYLQGKKFIESFALLQRCQSEAKEASEQLETNELAEHIEADAVPGHSRAQLVQLMHDLSGQADAETLVCKARYMLELARAGSVDSGEGEETGVYQSHTSQTTLKQPLVNSLNEYLPEKIMLNKLTVSASPLVPFPPDFDPVPVKPAFFDLALNHINFPLPPTPNVSASITGFMRGLLWGSGTQAKS